LRDAGHDVLTASEANLRNVRDADVFAAAILDNRILLNNNPDDFVALHNTRMGLNQPHPGLFLVYRQNKPSDMNYDQIVKAIANLESTFLPFLSACHSLNNYNY
jgi:predicted nuclease of predicted toxin-antitoxin system